MMAHTICKHARPGLGVLPLVALTCLIGAWSSAVKAQQSLPYPVVDTGQTHTYDNSGEIAPPQKGQAFYGQDAQYDGNQPRYADNGDGTVTDLVTGLMWSQTPDLNGDGVINAEDKLTYAQALAGAKTFRLAGYDDWRLPTIKELYSLIDFNGNAPTGQNGSDGTPFIDTGYFAFGYGDTSAGERVIDAQFATCTKYVSTTMNGADTMFGVNFADGRIKGYPTGSSPDNPNGKTFYVLYVRGNPDYGRNDFVDNGDGTVTDLATGLMWSKEDSGTGMDWEAALAWVQEKNAENYLGHDDWRLPNAKELQSIVDYDRSPNTTDSAAIDPVFDATPIVNEGGQPDYPWYWTGTTHIEQTAGGMDTEAAYVAFGRALGWMGPAGAPCLNLLDVHGAGAQRSDPKSGSPTDYTLGVSCSDGGPAYGRGPQGDVVRIDNFVRLVRDAGGTFQPLSASFTCSPADPTNYDPITFTAAASGGTPPYSYAWVIDGASYTGQSVTGTFTPGTHSASLSVTDAAGETATYDATFNVKTSVTIASATKLGSPFRIKVLGTGFQQGCTATIGGVPVQVAYKNAGKIKLKHCKSLCPKGNPVAIVVTNPDGTASAPFDFVR